MIMVHFINVVERLNFSGIVMKELLLFALTLSVLCGLSLSKSSAFSCEDLIIARKQWKVVKSPNFPNPFAPQTQCNWVIQAMPGYRVEIQFESFYLVGGQRKGCLNQLIKITDMFSKVTDGPYCGNTPPPPAISTGKAIRVTLESNTIGVNSLYKGFKAKFRWTRRISTNRLRDARGKWKLYSVRGGDVIVATTNPPPIMVTRDPNEVDGNNNAAIDAKNNEINSDNLNFNERVNVKNNALNAPPTQEKPLLTTKRRRGPSIQYQSTTTSSLTAIIYPRPRRTKPILTPSLNTIPPPRNQPEGNDEAMIIGVVVGVLFLLFLLLLVFILCKTKKPKEGRNVQVAAAANNNQIVLTRNNYAKTYHKNQELSRVRYKQKRHNRKDKYLPRTAHPHANKTKKHITHPRKSCSPSSEHSSSSSNS